MLSFEIQEQGPLAAHYKAAEKAILDFARGKLVVEDLRMRIAKKDKDFPDALAYAADYLIKRLNGDPAIGDHFQVVQKAYAELCIDDEAKATEIIKRLENLKDRVESGDLNN